MLTEPGGQWAESPHCLVFPCTEFSQSPAKSITGKFRAEQHGWVMLRIWLCSPAPQLPLFCPVSSVAPPSYTSSISPPVKLVEVPRLQLWQEGLGGFGLEHRILALSVVTCAVFMARPCQHVGGCSRSSCSPPWVQVPCPVWELGLWPQHRGHTGMESRFVSQLQLNSVT